MKKRRKCKPEEKANKVLDVLREEKTLTEITVRIRGSSEPAEPLDD